MTLLTAAVDSLIVMLLVGGMVSTFMVLCIPIIWEVLCLMPGLIMHAIGRVYDWVRGHDMLVSTSGGRHLTTRMRLDFQRDNALAKYAVGYDCAHERSI